MTVKKFKRKMWKWKGLHKDFSGMKHPLQVMGTVLLLFMGFQFHQARPDGAYQLLRQEDEFKASPGKDSESLSQNQNTNTKAEVWFK
jgi:hypothetical protein